MKPKQRKFSVLCCLLALSFQTAFAADPSDPYEGYNRFMFRVNDTLDHYVMTPVAETYRKVTPSPVRTGVRNFFDNLRDVVSLGSNILRLDVEKAATDFVRIGLNTTFGLGGLINIANAGGIPDNKNTLGDTFASWGWKNSSYFVYPLLGPSTVRDSLGSTVWSVVPVQNTFVKDAGARWGMVGLNAVQMRENALDLTDGLDDMSLDKYAYVRDVYMSVRNKQVGLPATDDDDIDDDSDSSANTASADTAADDSTDTPATEQAAQTTQASDTPAPSENGQSEQSDAVQTPHSEQHGWTEEVVGRQEHTAEQPAEAAQ